MLCMPSLRTLVETLQLPSESAAALPTATPSLKIVTVLSGSAVPLKVGVATFVMLSVCDAPLSVASIRSGADGAAGATASWLIVGTLAAAD